MCYIVLNINPIRIWDVLDTEFLFWLQIGLTSKVARSMLRVLKLYKTCQNPKCKHILVMRNNIGKFI